MLLLGDYFMSRNGDLWEKYLEERERYSFSVHSSFYKFGLPLFHTIILSQVIENRDEETNIDNGGVLSNEWLATILRTSVFRVSKVLAELHQNGYIEFNGKTSNRRIRYGKTYWEYVYNEIKEGDGLYSYMPFDYWYKEQEGWY